MRPSTKGIGENPWNQEARPTVRKKAPRDAVNGQGLGSTR